MKMKMNEAKCLCEMDSSEKHSVNILDTETHTNYQKMAANLEIDIHVYLSIRL